LSTIEKRDEAIDLARYKQAAEEIENGSRDEALWYKAFAEGSGDDKATKAAYIRLRVEQLRRTAVAASAVRVTATQPSPAYTPATPTVKPKPNGAKNLYDVLSITQDASNEQILAGYQTQKSILDARENQDAETKNSLIFIQHAKEVLLDPAKRAAYDARITAEAAQPEKIGREKSAGSRPASASEPLSNQDLYAAYLGEKNQDYYLKKFEKFDQQGDGMHASFNWPALLFGVWPLYRKMYGWFFVFLGIAFLAGIVDWWVVISKMPSLSMLPTIISITYWIFFTAYVNSLYHKHVKKKIAVAQPIARNDTELLKILRKEGGVHAWVIWVFLAIFIIGIIASIVIPAYSDKTKNAKAASREPQLSTDTRIPPARTEVTGWVKLLCSGSVRESTILQFSEEAYLVRINGTEYVPKEMSKDWIRVSDDTTVELSDAGSTRFINQYTLNRVSGELQSMSSIIFPNSGGGGTPIFATQYCKLATNNKF